MWAEMRLGLDSDRPGSAVAAAEEILRGGSWPLRVQLFLGDVAVEALARLGRAADAERLVERATADGASPEHPWYLRMRGRAAAAAGRLDEAVLELRRAVEVFRTNGCGHEESRTRMALAGVLAEEGDVETAQIELRTALESAESRGAALEARVARETLAGLGSRAVTSEHVKEALEALHEPRELARVPLGRLLGLDAAIAGEQLRPLLTDQIDRLIASPKEKERQAGQVLRDCYVRRVGSHEVVAARLYMTRATFYRRLHLGWEQLGKRLTDT
jgi:tetratricopeptide (TPR) repeat protein